jgi:hypothetical protein
MYDIDPEGLEERTPGLMKRKRAGHFTTRGPNWVHSLFMVALILVVEKFSGQKFGQATAIQS